MSVKLTLTTMREQLTTEELIKQEPDMLVMVDKMDTSDTLDTLAV